MKKEEWRNIPGFEGYYQVSDMGNVRSLDRWVTYSNGGDRFYKGRIIDGSVNNKGYRKFTLRKNSRGRAYSASQLVAMAFLNHTPNGHESVIDHKNGIRTDDRVENLQIVTNRANCTTCFRSNEDSFTSDHVGVSWHTHHSKWRSRINYENIEIHLGFHNNELDASDAYQKALSKIEHGIFNPEDYKLNYTSIYKGVYFDKKVEKFRARIQIKNKYINIGIFKTELEAHNALNKFKLENNI